MEAVLSRLLIIKIRSSSERFVSARRWGLRWSLDLGDNLQRRLFFARSYEGAALMQLGRRLRSDDLILDVGANVGTFLLPLLHLVATRGKGIAVEPAFDAVARLEEHVHRNGLAERVAIVPIALGDKNATAFLMPHDTAGTDTGMRSVHSDGDPSSAVDLRRGDQLVEDLGVDRIDVLKVDVEGAEHAVLLGLEGELHHRPPRLIMVELVRRRRSPDSENVRATVDLLERLGYRGWWIRYRGLVELNRHPDRDGNALFMKVE